ncbi:MAG TPA: zinc ribbon domain-containing protein [Longimicrobiales bacterium]
MEMLVIALVALAAFAAVLVPLFRRRPGRGDESEFENIPPADGSVVTPEPARAHAQGAGSDDELEAEVQRYREAVRAGTVCRKCGQANPPQSRFCYECGATLPLGDAREYE